MSTLTIRPATSADTAAMRQLTRNVWGGTDYLPHVWQEWLRDPDGFLMAAADGGAVVGLQHIGVQPDGSAWAEGIRVAEEVRGRGVGRALLAAGVEWAVGVGCPRIRLATANLNPASNRLAESAGMGVIAEYPALEASAAAAPTSGRIATAADFASVLRLIAQTSIYTEGWTAYSLNADRVRLLLARQAVIVAGEPARAAGILTAEIERPNVKLGLLVGEQDEMVEIASYARHAAATAGKAGVRAMVNGKAPEVLGEAGFQPRDMRMLVYERRLTPGVT